MSAARPPEGSAHCSRTAQDSSLRHRRRAGVRRLSAIALACVLSGGPWQPSAGAMENLEAPSHAQTLHAILDALRSPPTGSDTRSLALARTGLKQAADLDLASASKTINEALQLDAHNSYLHFFNGFIYHLQARQGDSEKAGMAMEGYEQAIRLDPSNWIAHDFLGLALLEQKQYGQAQSHFAEVLLIRPDDAAVLSRMMFASYMAGDAGTACTMADRLSVLPQAATPGYYKASVSVYSACGDFDKAADSRFSLAALTKNPDDQVSTGQRMSQWRSFYRSRGAEDGTAPRLIKTQFAAAIGAGKPAAAASPAPAKPSAAASPAPAAAAPRTSAAADKDDDDTAPAAADVKVGDANTGDKPATKSAVKAASDTGGTPGTRMVLVDVVMVRTEDTISSSQGVNLLSALQLQFGSSTGPAYSRAASTTLGASGSTILTRALTIPALTYSLNLANANSNLNEVLARPTLAAVEGQKSEFFSGTSLNAAVVSSGSGSGGSAVSIEKHYGVKLSVLPEILPNGMIKLSVDAARTFLKPASSDIGFTYKLEISEITANANVVMHMGDTLVLGGLSEKESTTNRDGVPFLQDVPLVQYLFSQRTRTEYQRSVLILITPRPAAYTWLAEDGKPLPGNADGSTGSVDVLRARYTDWFKPYPNLASVFHHLNQADLYREFRTGDVTLERWDRMDTTRQRLEQALGFLYY